MTDERQATWSPPGDVGRAASSSTPDQDRELVEMVRAAGSESAEARLLKESLQETGVGALTRFHSNGTLLKRVKEKGVRFVESSKVDLDDYRTLIHLATSSALSRFMRKQVFGDGWHPHKGASLRTYFVSSCLYAFGEEYVKFCREEDAPSKFTTFVMPTHDLDDVLTVRASRIAPAPATDPQTQVLDRDEIERLLTSLRQSPDDLLMLFRYAQGFTFREIADEIGISESALHRRFRRLRKRIAANLR